MIMELNEAPSLMRGIYDSLVRLENKTDDLKRHTRASGEEWNSSARFLENAQHAIGSAMHYAHYAYEQMKMAEEQKEYTYIPSKQPTSTLHITAEMIESLGYDVIKDNGQYLQAISRFPKGKMSIWLNREGNHFGVRNDYDTRDSFNGQVRKWEQIVAIVDCIQ